MPFIGGGLHFLVAAFFAIHAVRRGQPLYWLLILFSFPFLGSLVYFFAIYLPNSRLENQARRAVVAAVRAIDPTREVREARHAFEEVPTVQNQMRLAAALLETEAYEEAAQQYETCLKGPFASDLHIRFGAARAFTACQKYEAAQEHLEAIRAQDANFHPEGVCLLLARCHAGLSRPAQAREYYEQAVQRFGTFAAYAEYEIWALAVGDTATAQRLHEETDKMVRRWNSITRDLNAPELHRLQAARELARKGQ